MLKKTKIAIAAGLVTSSLLVFNPTQTNASTQIQENLDSMNGEEIFEYYENNPIQENQIQPRMETPGGCGGAPVALDGHSLYDTNSSTKSIKIQNRETMIEVISTAVVGTAVGYYSWTAGAVVTTLGLNSSVDTLITGEMGAQFPLEIREYIYLADNPTATYGGYSVIQVYNADTGAYVESNRQQIAKLG